MNPSSDPIINESSFWTARREISPSYFHLYANHSPIYTTEVNDAFKCKNETDADELSKLLEDCEPSGWKAFLVTPWPYHIIVRGEGGELTSHVYDKSSRIPAKRIGTNHNPSQRIELQGLPIFEGYRGPLWDKNAIRYEPCDQPNPTNT